MGPYSVFGASDTNGDGEFAPDEPVGFYPTTRMPELVTVPANGTLRPVNFVLAPMQTVRAEVGEACTADADCVGNACFQGASWPGGYCTQDCLSTGLCPNGSACYYDDTSKTTAHCYDVCAAGVQGECRTGYACTQASADEAICFPAR